jgi:hypothetical protein
MDWELEAACRDLELCAGKFRFAADLRNSCIQLLMTCHDGLSPVVTTQWTSFSTSIAVATHVYQAQQLGLN